MGAGILCGKSVHAGGRLQRAPTTALVATVMRDVASSVVLAAAAAAASSLLLLGRRRRAARAPPAPAPYGRSELTEADAAWLHAHQHRKVLDARVRVLGVAARNAAGQPAVLVCYPLRETGGAYATHGDRRDTRVVTNHCRKWAGGDAPVPWPNHLWLVDPALSARVGRLEHLGYVQAYQADVKTDAALASALEAAHRSYGATRWAELSNEDRAYAEGAGYAAVLREAGVGGLRFANQVKCLHAHLAHHLAGGRNPIGKRVVDALARGDDRAALAGARQPHPR